MSMRLTLLLLTIVLAGCGPTTTGNPVSQVQLRMEDKQPFAWFKKSLDSLIQPAHATVSNVTFCFKRLRFKPDAVTAGDNIDLLLGEVSIDPSGTNLLTVTVPEGTYQRIEFDLDKECEGTPAKPSVAFTNDQGSFSTQDSMTIKFDGSFTVGSSSTLTLNIDAFFDVIDPITADGQIKTALEGVSGDF